jgi:hypothetical protein
MKDERAGENSNVGEEVSLERQTYTVAEAAKILGICRTVAYRKGVLPTVKVAGRRLSRSRRSSGCSPRRHEEMGAGGQYSASNSCATND